MGVRSERPVVSVPGRQDTQPDVRGNTLLYTADYNLALFTLF
jgi:hypothetical protein